MEPSSRTKRILVVVATVVLVSLSLSSRVEEGALYHRWLLVLDPQTVVQKQISYPEQVRPWGQDGLTTPRSLAETSNTPADLEGSEEAHKTNLRSNFPPDGVEDAKQPEISHHESTPRESKSPEILSPHVPHVPRTTFNLPKSAEEWCAPPEVPPLPYTECKDTLSVNQLPLYGGLTNSLKMLLLGAILSFEQHRCFYVDETVSALPKRSDPANAFSTSFLDRYFEPIGIPESDAMVKSARYNENLKVVDWRESWEWTHNRRVAGQMHDIDSLGYTNMEGHRLKRIMLKRMWRPLPAVRQQTCSQLEQHVGPEEFMAFSVRRGDKATENFQFATADQYIEAAEKATISKFGGVVPTIFVASDDCSIMDEFRSKRPSWRFVSECDHTKQDGGFDLQEMKDWTHEVTDAHFNKFFVELYAMASAKYFIGVIYTNVTWWALFMRAQDPSTFEILFTPGTEKREGIEFW